MELLTENLTLRSSRRSSHLPLAEEIGEQTD